MVDIYNKYTNVRDAARNASHGLTNNQVDEMRDRFEKHMPGLASKYGSVRTLLDDKLPEGASWPPVKTGQYVSQTGYNGAGNNGVMTTVQTPYQPEFSSPDRQQYPVHRILANRYWRMFYKLDPLIGSCIELFSDLPWSSFELTGDGVEGDIRYAYETMCRETQLLALLPYLVREFLVVGEVLPHCYFDDSKGIFTHIAMHNPDQIEIIDAPFIKMDPIIEFIPDDRLRSVLTSNSPALREIRNRMPPELLSRLQARSNISLSPINATFIPRKLHPYDTRGTSLISRLWRILMYEDAVFNASIQTARRQACFVAGTSVLTSDGIKNIEDIVVGDRVISGSGKFETVEAAWEEPPSETITINSLGTQPLTCTPNHNFLVWRSPTTCACGCGGKVKRHKGYVSAFINSHNTTRNNITGRIGQSVKEWKVWSNNPLVRTVSNYEPLQKIPASEIKSYDYLLIPRKFDEIKPDCTLDQARLLGYYVAEGYVKCDQMTLCLGLGDSERENSIADDAINILGSLNIDSTKKIVYTESQQKTNRKPNILVTSHDSKQLVDWLSINGGNGAANKRFSENVMCWPLEYKKELIKGLYLGDGSRSKCSNGDCHQVAMCLTSQSIISQTRLILAQLGIFSSISSNPKKHIHENWEDCWIISSTGSDARTLSKLIFNEDIDSPWGDECRKGMKTWMDDNYVYIPVQSVEYNKVLVQVYNLTVSGDHSYTANVVQTYNSPLKVVKMGNATTGWIPSDEQQKRMIELLAQSEMDPCAWLVTHYGVQFETVGSQDRLMGINREYEIIERIKLTALGVSKSFLSGEVSYASASTGLQLFLQKLRSMRLFFEQKWLYPKFFKTIAEINGWVKPKPSEVAHRFRVKRSAQELDSDNRYIIPKIVWDKSLDHNVSTELIQAMTALENLGVKFSKTSKMATVGYSFEEETKKMHRENEFEKTYLPKLPEENQQGGDGKAAPGGLGGAPPMPPPPSEDGGPPPKGPPGGPGGVKPPGEEGAPPPKGPPGAAKGDVEPGKLLKDVNLDSKQSKSSLEKLKSKIWIDDKHGNWDAKEVSDLIDLFETLDSDSAFWSQLGSSKDFKKSILNNDMESAWVSIAHYLEDNGYPNQDINQLRNILEEEKIVKTADSIKQLKMLEAEYDSEENIEFANKVIAANKEQNNGNKITNNDSFLTGCS